MILLLLLIFSIMGFPTASFFALGVFCFFGGLFCLVVGGLWFIGSGRSWHLVRVLNKIEFWGWVLVVVRCGGCVMIDRYRSLAWRFVIDFHLSILS